jgi:hypothetical protein
MHTEFSKPFTMMTFFSAFLVFLLANHISDMWAFAQALDDQSFASSTICMHDEPCRTWFAAKINHAVLRERQILKILRYGKDMMDECDEEFE